MASICVFCGSSRGINERYAAAAQALGAALAARGHRLVYGGASVGLMGILADAVLEGGGDVLGVLPEALLPREIDHPRLSSLERVATMAQRKERMIDASDAFVALPGGVGTLDEVFEVLCGQHIKAHEKPLGLLDTAGYWSALVSFMDHARSEGFVPEHLHEGLIVESTEAELLERLEARL